MSKQASKTLIGAFVVGALALVVIGILLFGSGQFFSEGKTYVLFFRGSVKGLNVGAPVSFRGVKVGQVTAIKARFDPRDYAMRIAVFIKTNPSWLTSGEDEKPLNKILPNLAREKILEDLVKKKGLRAQLQLQSLVTGLLEVEFDFFPDTPIRLLGAEPNVPELPTIPSDMEKLQMTVSNAIAKFEKLPLDELMTNLVKAVNGIERLTSSPELTDTISSLNKTLKTVQQLAQTLNSRVGPIASNLEGGITSARDALEQANRTLAAVEKVAGGGDTLRYQLSQALEEISGAARSLRVTLDSIEQHPESLIRGKEKPGGK